MKILKYGTSQTHPKPTQNELKQPMRQAKQISPWITKRLCYVAWLFYSQSNFVFSSLVFVIRGYQTNQFPKATVYNTWWRKAVSFKVLDKIICKYSWHWSALLFLIKHLKIISDSSPGSCASCLLRLVLTYIFGLSKVVYTAVILDFML